MRSLHHLVLDAVHERRTLRASASSPALGRLLAAQEEFESDVDVLNYALTLEHLESTFYVLAGNFGFAEDPFGNSITDYLIQIGTQETAHVETLTEVISDLGGEPIERAEYDFGVDDEQSFLETAMLLENFGVSAYYGAASAIEDPGLLTAAGGIAAVEARHAAYLNLLNGVVPFESAFEEALPPEEIYDVIGTFNVPDEATDEDGEDEDSENATPAV